MIDEIKLAKIRLEKENERLKKENDEILKRVNAAESMIIDLAYKSAKVNLK